MWLMDGEWLTAGVNVPGAGVAQTVSENLLIYTHVESGLYCLPANLQQEQQRDWQWDAWLQTLQQAERSWTGVPADTHTPCWVDRSLCRGTTHIPQPADSFLVVWDTTAVVAARTHIHSSGAAPCTTLIAAASTWRVSTVIGSRAVSLQKLYSTLFIISYPKPNRFVVQPASKCKRTLTGHDECY